MGSEAAALAKFQRRMRAIPEAARRAVGPALVKGAQEIADLAEALAPEDTGDLKNSIMVTGPGGRTPPYSQPGGSAVMTEMQAAVTVGSSDVRYPHLVEYGTEHAPAQPFFWPAFRARRKRATDRVKRAIRAAIKGTKR